MADNPHFEPVSSWDAARDGVEFEPLVPSDTAGGQLLSLSLFVMDHRGRRLAPRERSLEAHYDGFVIDQRRAGSPGEASRLALATSYGLDPRPVTVDGSEGRRYALGPTVDDDDVDGRSPAIVVWSHGDLVCLIASTHLDDEVLVRIARSTTRS